MDAEDREVARFDWRELQVCNHAAPNMGGGISMDIWKANVGWAAVFVTWVFMTSGCAGVEDGSEVEALGAAPLLAMTEGGSSIDPADPCASLTAPGEPPARIVWLTDPDGLLEIHISDMTSLDWIFQYATRTPPGEQAAYTIEHERCGAGEVTCSVFHGPTQAEECAVAYARFGIDPEQYHPGLNTYHFFLRLLRDGAVESSSEMTLQVMVDPVPQPP
jgi:hypothetical protein